MPPYSGVPEKLYFFIGYLLQNVKLFTRIFVAQQGSKKGVPVTYIEGGQGAHNPPARAKLRFYLKNVDFIEKVYVLFTLSSTLCIYCIPSLEELKFL